MTAPLINPGGAPMNVEVWKTLGDEIESMSTFVSLGANNLRTTGFDAAAERRLWGSSAHVDRADAYPLERGDLYPVTVVAVGEKCQHHTDWDRVIWTNEEPHHNVGRVFVGREELEDV